MTRITPCLWFNNSIDEAIAFYTETFPDGKLIDAQRQSPDGPAFTATIELAGNRFMLLNGSGAEQSRFPFTEAVSFMIHCDGQDEVDHFWDAFVADGGEESMCGWCKDKFGLSWQVVPKQLFETMGGSDRAGAGRAQQAMLKMRKIVVADLEKAYAGT